MRVKRYVVDTLPEAMEKIRIDLGKDAIILNTKKVKLGGFLGLFRKEKVEVLAASDRERNKSGINKVIETKTDPAIDDVLLQINASLTNQLQRAPSGQEIKQQNKQSEADKLKLMSNTLKNKSTSTYPVASQPATNQNELAEEIREMRGMVLQMMQKEGVRQLPPALKKYYDLLLNQEVEEEIALYITGKVMEKSASRELGEKEAYQLVFDEIVEILSKGDVPVVNASTRFYHFVGPTGVGKTTTIAKLAAEFVMEQEKKVGLITSDTYRIAAIEQLRTYANILDLPLEVVYKVSDLQAAVIRLANQDLIFMDTAGRNYRSQEYLDELTKLLNSSIPSETFLVLSLTSKYTDIKDIIERFTKINVDKVIFTKLDETSTYGAILNILYHHDLKLSYLTNGQSVPDDILEATPEQIAHYILGGKQDG